MSEQIKLKRSLPYRAQMRRQDLVITQDEQLMTFANRPDEPVKGNSVMPSWSMNQFFEQMEGRKTEILTFFHDHFFGGGERKLHLTTPEFLDCTRKIAEMAESRGIGIGASVTNPLDLGRTFKEDLGTGGQHRTFAEGILAADGSFSFNAYLAQRWTNNKGHIYPAFDRARLFVFRENCSPDSQYIAIPWDSIQEIPADQYTLTVSDEPWERSAQFGNHHMKVEGRTSLSGDRVFAVFYMDTPEMDYFHPGVDAYVRQIIDQYREAGVEFLELYSDEMHIQFDWDFAHFGPHEIPTRYMTPNFEAELAKIDPIFADFDKALLYFGYDMEADRKAYGKITQHVLGLDPAGCQRTFLMRSAYFEALQDRVVGICCDARDYIRSTYSKHAGADPLCLGHATWQESPTCDKYTPAGMFNVAVQAGKCTYDYTPEYVYSSTIREAISGCYDYFKWNDYFSYGGVDHCECGWFDRNYYGGALAASLGTMNRNQAASWGAWGFPDEARRRFRPVAMTMGAQPGYHAHQVTWGRPRQIDVLTVYPKHLTAVEERFGSWMVQFGYTNYLPADRLVKLGQVENGRLIAGLGSYSTIVVEFEPFYAQEFINLLAEFAAQGGTVVWNSTPACLESGAVAPDWLALFGLEEAASLTQSISEKSISFTGALEGLEPMAIPTDLLPDRVYPVRPGADAAVVACSDSGKIIGTLHKIGQGQALYFGCRLRDDQSGDSGDAPSTLFDLLKRVGAYGGPDAADNPETIGRHSEFFASRFANGTYSLCRHYRTMRELWVGGFGRNQEVDRKTLEQYPHMVSRSLDFSDFALDGHKLTYQGTEVVQFRLDEDGRLLGFFGPDTTGICLDGTNYHFCDTPSLVLFNEMDPERLPDGFTRGWTVQCGAAALTLPYSLPADAQIFLDRGADGQDLARAEDVTLDGNVLQMGSAAGHPLVILA